MINRHGLKMKGLKITAGTTKYANQETSLLISYDTTTGQILTTFVPCSRALPTYYRMINVVATEQRMSMQEIADKIAETVAERA